METLSYILVIGGLVVMLLGIVMLWRPPKAPSIGGRPEELPDIGEYLEKIKELLEIFDKHVRTGLAVMFFGLALIGLGVFLATRDTKDTVEDKAPAKTALVRHY